MTKTVNHSKQIQAALSGLPDEELFPLLLPVLTLPRLKNFTTRLAGETFGNLLEFMAQHAEDCRTKHILLIKEATAHGIMFDENLTLVEHSRRCDLYLGILKQDCKRVETAFKKLTSNDVTTVRKAYEYAVNERSTVGIQALLKAKADINIPGKQGNSLLHYACARGDTQVAHILTQSGIDLESEDGRKLTPLHWGCYNGQTVTVQMLLHAKANIEAETYRKETPLHMASENGQTDTVKILLSAKANVLARALGEFTPLHKAAKKGHTSTVSVLIRHNADLNSQTTSNKETALYCATKENREDTVRVLLQAKSDIHIQNAFGQTPLDYARENGQESIVKLFQEIAIK